MTLNEQQLEESLVATLVDLKYTHREDIRDRAALEKNFREKFNALNHVRLTDAEFDRLLLEITTPDVFAAAKTLRGVTAGNGKTPTSANSQLSKPN